MRIAVEKLLCTETSELASWDCSDQIECELGWVVVGGMHKNALSNELVNKLFFFSRDVSGGALRRKRRIAHGWADGSLKSNWEIRILINIEDRPPPCSNLPSSSLQHRPPYRTWPLRPGTQKGRGCCRREDTRSPPAYRSLPSSSQRMFPCRNWVGKR